MINKAYHFTIINLKGIAQIMLQDNAVTGLLFMLGVLYSSWLMALGMLIATLTGTILGYSFKKNREDLNQGLYGFNAALMGIILVYQFGLNYISVIAIIISSILATYFFHFTLLKNWKVFTFPFVVFSWLFVSLLSNGNFMSKTVHPTAAENFLQEPTAEFFEESLESVGIEYDDDKIDDDLIFSTHGFGQVMFQGSVVAGVFFLLGVYINKPVSALYGIFGSILAITISHLLNHPESSTNNGMFSFNAVLCAIAFSGVLKRDGFWVVISTIITVVIDDYLIKMNIPPYTFPFVATMWIVLYSRKGIRFISEYIPNKKISG
ncbi:urea transporter [Salegentibacter holothuriorum]|uniref:Urea transporter n=1 Tax=Salegentibacter holothuriorum TaxID=241145 RepID=A0A1T5DA24_9FLAO|nr:urea transporter [Salegentibacter holothuriorum]SKB68340.1 urea transporter [Salegentibacter holothuriorum]